MNLAASMIKPKRRPYLPPSLFQFFRRGIASTPPVGFGYAREPASSCPRCGRVWDRVICEFCGYVDA